MERSEPSLVPQWLKYSGTQNGSGSVSHSDDHTGSKIANNKLCVDSNGNDFKRSFSFDKTTSSYFRRGSSSNGSGPLRSRSSFGRNQHDWERGTYDSRIKDKSFLGDRNRRHLDLSDSLGNNLLGKFERDGLRRSHSLVSGKRGDASCNKVVTDSSNTGYNSSELLSKGSPVGGVAKITFEKDFPLLGAEERAVPSEVGRVPSPGPSSVIQSLPIGTSTNITGEKWTSALAEVPVSIGSNGTGMSAAQHEAASSSASLQLGTSSSLNMAEAVAQGPNRAQTAPQLSVGTHRLEELAIKQSKQLIPVTPSSPKTLVLNSLDKQKTRVGQQQNPASSSLTINHSPRGGPVKSDASRTTNVGKLQVLKPVREKNIPTPAVKDNSNQTSVIKLVNSPLAGPSVSGPAATKAPLTSPGQERKRVLEKRPTSQAQSRNDFFNSVRKKSMADSSSGVNDSSTGSTSSVTDTSTVISPSTSDKLSETEIVHTPNTPPISNGSFGVTPNFNCNGHGHVKQTNARNQNRLPSSEEEEAAFLRSLGWEENADEGGLTQEEINAFFQDATKYINSNPSLKILQPKFVPLIDSHIGSIAGLSSSDAKLES